MTTGKSKSVRKAVVKNVPHGSMTLTIPVPKPRNRLALDPLLKKSAVHATGYSRNKRERDSALEVQQDVQEALNRRRGGGDGGKHG